MSGFGSLIQEKHELEASPVEGPSGWSGGWSAGPGGRLGQLGCFSLKKSQGDLTAAPSYLQRCHQEHQGQALHSGGRTRHKEHNL